MKLQSLAERTGFDAPSFLNYQWPIGLALKSFDTHHLPCYSYYRLIPVKTGQRGRQQGQNRDNFFITLLVSTLGIGLLGVASVVDNNPNDSSKSRRRKPRPREERGLPDSKTLRELATAYLKIQHRLWPELVKSGDLPKASKAVIDAYVKDFTDRFLDQKKISPFQFIYCKVTILIASAYFRFSSDKSNPRSLVQQLKLTLEKAESMKYFIPWQYIFADAGVSATTSDRIGYQLLKRTLEDESLKVDALFIDEIGRANREMIEALTLGAMFDDQSKILIGVSDGFDSRLPMSKIQLSIFAALQEWFIDQLRSKVHRGMRDAHDRGTNLRPPAIGYKLDPAVDQQGNPMYGKDSERLNMLVIDETAAKMIHHIFELFAIQKWSRTRIGRYLNDLKFGEQQWDATHVTQILERYKYVGINVEKMTRTVRVKNKKTGKTRKKTIKRPKREWQAKRMRTIQIVSWKLWKAAQKQLSESAKAYPPKDGEQTKSRTEVNPTTLVRPVCGCCGKEMWLGKSGKHASFTCLNGREGKHNCTYRGYKTVKIVEDTILKHVLNDVLTEDRFIDLIDRANSYLTQEAAKPAVDTSAWKDEIKKTAVIRNRLASILEEEGTQDLGTLVSKLRKQEKRISELNSLIRNAESAQRECQPIGQDDAFKIMSNIRLLLNEEVTQAAPLLREITGPVVVHINKEPGKTRPNWIAEFTINLVPVIAKLAASGSFPTTGTWEYLNTRGWKLPIETQILLGKPPKYETLAPEMLELHENGTSVSAIASAYETSSPYVNEILTFAKTGERPQWKAGNRTGKGSVCKYKQIADEVKMLRDEKHYSFPRIQKWIEEESSNPMKVGRATIQRAYDYAHKAEIRETILKGEKPQRGRCSHIGADKEQQVCELFAKGLSDKEVVNQTGVSLSTVRRLRRKQ